MAGRWTFGRKIALGFGAAAVVLLIVAVSGFISTANLVANDLMVSHTHEVRQEIAHLQGRLVDAETGQRGFLITGEDVFLEPYHAALSDIDASIARLKKLTSDNTVQQRNLENLRPLIDRQLAGLQDRLELRRSTGLEAATKSLETAAQKHQMDQIRSVMAGMDNEELSLLAARGKAAEATSQFAHFVIVGGTIVGLLLVSLIGWYIARSLSAEIGEAVGKVTGSSTELQAAANQQVAGAKEQSTAMNEIGTTISELLATSRQIAESSQRVAQISEQTAAGARAGDATVQKAHDSVVTIRKQVDLIVSHMLDLGKKSQQIGGILEIINELSEQTNILSINASIEAVGAGDAGKRFGAVAEEIRKLADRVGGSTKEIRALIEEMRASVNSTVMSTETGSKAVDAGMQQFREVAASFRNITTVVVTASEAAREIELSTKQQSTAVEQVNIAIANVSQATRESEASASQTLQTASQMTGLSKELAQIVWAASA
jgi:CHASE3 domain sensor protein